MRHVIRLATAVFSMMITTVFIPNFAIHHFQTAFIIGIVIAVIGWIIEFFLQGEVSPFARGIIGVLSTAAGLILFSMTNLVTINLSGLLITSLLTGTVDLFLPTYARYTD